MCVTVWWKPCNMAKLVSGFRSSIEVILEEDGQKTNEILREAVEHQKLIKPKKKMQS